jgi:hypothetical protein
VCGIIVLTTCVRARRAECGDKTSDLEKLPGLKPVGKANQRKE